MAIAAPSPLGARGYTVIPAPQRVELSGSDFEFGPGWRVETAAAARGTAEVLREELGGPPHNTGRESTLVRVAVRPGSVEIGAALDSDRDVLARQAYRLEMHPGTVTISANAEQGAFYGVETLAQLLKRSGGPTMLPEGTITDWPDLQARNMYWDDAHHLDRPEALKRAIRTAASFKITGFVIKLEGHFQFKSAPEIVEPYALSPAELQDLTNYGLRYHVQVIPYLDAPAHIAFILKHPAYLRLRAFPDSNYELCATNPDAAKLIESMSQDLIDANKGVDTFYLSTDEAYYIGMAQNAQCDEKSAADRLGSRGKLLAEFVTKTATYLHDRGRKVVFWGEFPLRVDDIPSLPKFITNGEVYGPAYDKAYRKHGIRQNIYTSTQGEERIFPEYFRLPESRRLHPARTGGGGRVEETFEKVSFDQARGVADLHGMFVAGWADAGQHADNFWLGYVSATAAGWHPGSLDAFELTSSFLRLFYGPSAAGMERAYQLLSYQAQFWSDSWEPATSTLWKGIWGNSNMQFTPRRPRRDQVLPLPAAPDDRLRYTGTQTWRADNTRRLQLAAEFRAENDELLGILGMNLPRAERNRYTLEVLRSEALLCRENLDLLSDLERVDRLLGTATQEAAATRARQAVGTVDQALGMIVAMRNRRNKVLDEVMKTWYKTWFPRVAEANGRVFRHDLDDVKDHVPDRTVDMSYLLLREILLPVDDWVGQIVAARNGYARANGLPETSFKSDWKDLSARSQVVTTPPSLE